MQLGLALLVEAAVGAATIAWVSTSTTLRMPTHRARCWLPGASDANADAAGRARRGGGGTVLL